MMGKNGEYLENPGRQNILRASECGRHTKSSVFAGVVASEWVHYWVSLGVLRRDV